MGQQEVFSFLRTHSGEWWSAQDLTEKLDITIGSVTASLRKLRQFGQVTSKREGRKNYFMCDKP